MPLILAFSPLVSLLESAGYLLYVHRPFVLKHDCMDGIKNKMTHLPVLV